MALSDPILKRLTALHPKVIDLSLDRVRRLLAALGDPHQSLPPVVHVAGTNGKGSTLAFLRAMLEMAGLRVHVYTSPHLVCFNERIRLAGALISEERLLGLLEECEAANAGAPITFFEVTTAAAFLAFSRTPADILLLETGLGGRLDATNVIDRPAVTAITRVSYDHRHFLGDTLAAIAFEKAGILKPGVPTVFAPQPMEDAAHVLAERAAMVGAPVSPWRTQPLSHGFRFESAARRIDLPPPGLIGAHQIINAGVALACLDHLPVRVDDAAVARGLSAAHWPARLQRLLRGPLPSSLPAGWELWLDGGHNDSAGEVLAAQAMAWSRQNSRPLDLVFGMLASKEPREFLAPLAPHVRRLRAVAIPGEEASLSAEAAAEAARAVGIADAAPAADTLSALASLTRETGTRETGTSTASRALICGSLYLAGAVLAENG